MKKIISLCLVAIVIAVTGCKKTSNTSPVPIDPGPTARYGGSYITTDSSDWVQLGNVYTLHGKFDSSILNAIKESKKSEVLGYIRDVTLWPLPYSKNKTTYELQTQPDGYNIICHNTDFTDPGNPGERVYFVDVYIYK